MRRPEGGTSSGSQSLSARMASSVLGVRECVSMSGRRGIAYQPAEALTYEPVASFDDFEATTLPITAPRMMPPMGTGGT